MPFQRIAADKIAIGRDRCENDLCKVGRSAGCLAVDARDLGSNLGPLGGIETAFDGNNGVGRHGISSLSAGGLIACLTALWRRPVPPWGARPPARGRRTVEHLPIFGRAGPTL